MNAPPSEVADRLRSLGLDRAQLHGDERAEDFAAIDPARLWRVVRVRDEQSFREVDAWNPDNVAAAIAAARPDGVDVPSGVQRAARHKDPALVAAFISAARAAFSQHGSRV